MTLRCNKVEGSNMQELEIKVPFKIKVRTATHLFRKGVDEIPFCHEDCPMLKRSFLKFAECSLFKEEVSELIFNFEKISKRFLLRCDGCREAEGSETTSIRSFLPIDEILDRIVERNGIKKDSKTRKLIIDFLSGDLLATRLNNFNKKHGIDLTVAYEDLFDFKLENLD